MNFKKILEAYDYRSDADIINRIRQSDGSDPRENKDIINEIVLWKVNRNAVIDDRLICRIRHLEFSSPLEAAADETVLRIIINLLLSEGVQLAMASTILKMFHPAIFPIIDQRAYRELYSEDMPKYYSKDANEKYAKLYLDYIVKCFNYQQEHCPEIAFHDVDKLLYQIDKERGLKIRY